MTVPDLILDVLGRFIGPAGIDEVRDRMPARIGTPCFDAALLEMADAGRVVLFRDAGPASIEPRRLHRLLRDGRHVYTTVMAR